MRTAARRPRADGGVSLFPFLAVLLCTMGALIVLLIVLAQHARVQAVESNVRDMEQVQKLRDDYQQMQQRRRDLLRVASELSSQFQARRSEIDALNEEINRIDLQIGQLNKQRNQLLAKAPSDEQLAEINQALKWYSTKISEAERALILARKNLATKNKSYAIVPYLGPNAANRAPVYVECSDAAVILQPEGIVLTVDDFESMGRSNPLVAGIRATRMFYSQNPDTVELNPYPLLLVRPDGVYSFAAAQSALRAAGIEYGYELIEKDWDLAFPARNQQLALFQARAVDAARRVQDEFAATSRSVEEAARRERPQAFRFSPTDGGLVGLDGRGGGNNSGGGDGNSASRFSQGGRAATSAPGGTGRGESFDRDTGGFNSPAAGGSRYPDGAGRTGTGESSAGSGSGGRAGTLQGSGGGAIIGGEPGSGSSQGGQPGGGGEPSELNSMFAQGGDSGPTFSDVFGDRYDKHSAGAAPGGSATPGGGFGQGGSGSSQASGGQSSAGPSSSGQAGGDQSSGSSGSSGSFGSPSGGQASGGQASGGQARSMSGGQQGGSGTQPPDDQFQPGATATDSSPRPSSASVETSTAPGSSLGSPASAAQHLGDNWGLPGAWQSSIPITRPLKMRVTDQQLMILSDSRNAPPRKVIQLENQTARSLPELQQAIRKEIDGWGIAGRGMYWKPTLLIDVEPDGINRRDHLDMLLRNSGLEVRFRDISPSGQSTAADRPRYQRQVPYRRPQ